MNLPNRNREQRLCQSRKGGGGGQASEGGVRVNGRNNWQFGNCISEKEEVEEEEKLFKV